MEAVLLDSVRGHLSISLPVTTRLVVVDLMNRCEVDQKNT
jgi:hypothetical protein